MKLSRQYRMSLGEIARANNIAPHTMVKIGDRIVIPGVRAQHAAAPAAAAVAPKPQAAQAASPRKPAAPAPKVAAVQTTPSGAPATTARVVTPAAEQPAPQKVKADTTASAEMPTFRWPVRGRVISGFGQKPSGQQNDGINVAVPEGTPIKAAEDGVVAYAGNELKSYGNLVLVRHSNGYVTAYAHASEILVKRDEPIKRGQVIAKAGQSGSVAAPQLHFEIRKGSTPVDPMPFLDKGGSN
jgi:murein DD-endopeptidase MepM/ murein hydrolase activator NlpD